MGTLFPFPLYRTAFSQLSSRYRSYTTPFGFLLGGGAEEEGESEKSPDHKEQKKPDLPLIGDFAGGVSPHEKAGKQVVDGVPAL
ncbi:hypothetical protein CSW29_03470 [Thermus scotoductus]|uniref:Uncharacterized protein n=1 Tax=Thermus scotoductus TaxID=37636 RepID=A0A430R8H0_THESC|nr:hypothetical protein [Thermus scotoductus]RTH03689.1 hypothetical protein CSW47_08325 [Thermus scotoductus]RTI01854.1 hypothetical protein CSW29_03470 [Thermus scotoductus]